MGGGGYTDTSGQHDEIFQRGERNGDDPTSYAGKVSIDTPSTGRELGWHSVENDYLPLINVAQVQFWPCVIGVRSCCWFPSYSGGVSLGTHSGFPPSRNECQHIQISISI